MKREGTNPFKLLRLSYGMTMDQLADIAGVSHNLVVRNEQGLYPDPSPVLLHYFADSADAARRLKEDYHQWQTAHRKASYGILVEPPQFPFNPDSLVIPHPFVYWRELSHLNLTQFCKLYCIHQGVMHKFENSPHLVESLPAPLVHALLESGYDSQTLSNLARWYELYKTHLKSLALGFNSPSAVNSSSPPESSPAVINEAINGASAGLQERNYG